MFLISEFNKNKEDKNYIKNNLHNIIIGGECIIKRDFRGVAPYSYIILYKENKNNNIDYILQIEDKKEREEARDYILKNTIWNYLKKIEFKEDDEYKEIYNNNKIIIGYIVRNGTTERLKEIKHLEKENFFRLNNKLQNKNNSFIQKTFVKNIDNNLNIVNKNINNFNNIQNIDNNIIDFNNMNNFNNNINNFNMNNNVNNLNMDNKFNNINNFNNMDKNMNNFNYMNSNMNNFNDINTSNIKFLSL